MALLPPINLEKWVDDNRHLLKPPVGNKVIYEDSEFTVMVVGGPNARTDYHLNQGEEFFYMIEGDMVLKVVEDGEFRDIPIREGEIFLLPGNVPHSPQRKPNTVGLVIERERKEGEKDGLRWYCPECGAVVHEEYFQLHDIAAQLAAVIERFKESKKLRTCPECGHLHPAEPPEDALSA
jgi:3-hydroxyanthranilate 3,4-dioxygenase